MIKSPEYSFKITITGSPGVGKSSVLSRFCDGKFMDNYKSTIGVDFKFK
jgi:GTPase SAR1 family protein